SPCCRRFAMGNRGVQAARGALATACYEEIPMANPVPTAEEPEGLPKPRLVPPGGGTRGAAADERQALERALHGVEGGKWLRRLLIVLALIGVAAGIGVWRTKTRPPPPAKYVTA